MRPPPRSVKGAVLRAWRSGPQLTPTQIATRVGCHPSTARRHLLGLTDTAVKRCAAMSGCDIDQLHTNRSVPEGTRLAVSWSTWEKGQDARQRTAEDTSLSPMALRRLSGDSDPRVRTAVAANPATSVRTVERLALNDNTVAVRRAAIRSGRCSRQALAAVAAGTAEPIVQDDLTEQQNSPTSALRRLAAARDHRTVMKAAEHPNCPHDLLEALATEQAGLHRRGVAGNPTSPPHLIEQLAGDAALTVAAAALKNPSCPARVLDEMCRDGSPDRRPIAAGNPSCPPEAVAEAAVSDMIDVAAAAAANPACPTQTAVAAAGRGSPQVRRAAARGTATPPQVLHRLADDRSEQVRRKVAANPRTPADTLTGLAQDPVLAVRRAAASNPNCPPETLTQLALDRALDVQTATASNPNCPPETLTELLTGAEEPAAAAAANASTPLPVLHNAASAVLGAVRSAARRNPARVRATVGIRPHI